MAPMHEVYLILLAQMFMMQTVLMEQYSQLRTHIHGSELLTQSEATAAIFLQSTGGDVSDEEAMSCDDETTVMPPAVLRPSSSRQTLQGMALHKLLTQQPSLTPLPRRLHRPPRLQAPQDRLCVGVVVCGGPFMMGLDCWPHAPYSNSLY